MRKKIMAAVLGLSMGLSTAPAFAEETTAVLYNNQSVTMSQPVISDMGSVLLPFRGVAELIGAQVGFDGATNKVTAERDGMKIEFGIHDRTANVIRDGITEDVVYLTNTSIRNDRIYFDSTSLSQALDVKTGWDQAKEIVYIVDIERYTNDLFANTPGLDQFFTVFGQTPEKYKGTTEMKMQFDLEYAGGEDAPQAVNVAINLKEDAQKTSEAVREAIVLDLEKLNLPEGTGVDEIDFSKLRNIDIEIITDNNGVCYIKTDLVQKLAEAMPEIEELKTAAGIVTDGTWLQVDLAQFLEELGLSALVNIQADMQKTNMSKEIMEKMLKSIADMSVYSIEDAKMIDGIFAMYKTMFSEPYFKITGTETEGYELAMDINREHMTAILKDLMTVMGEENTELESQMPENFDIHIGATISPEKEMKMDMSMNIGGTSEDTTFNFVITMNSTMTPNSEGQTIEIPSLFIDLMQIGEMFNL